MRLRALALRYLPPNIPDFNPIEPVFFKLKTLLRSAQTRTLKPRWSVIGLLLGRFFLYACERYVRYYGLSQSR